VNQIEYTVTVFTQEPRALLTVSDGLVGFRNLFDWGPYPAGKLLYLGMDMTRVNVNLYEVTHRFLADGYFHARQQVWRLPGEGKPQVGADGLTIDTTQPGEALGANYNGKGAPVHWIQPYPFAALFTQLGIPGLSG
jgi:hypothetical protein